MMNKKLISLAVAAAMVAPAAALAEATLYGKLHVSIDYADVNNVILPTYGFQRDANNNIVLDADGYPTLIQTAPGEDFSGWGVAGTDEIPGEGRANRIGVKGSEDLGNGLKAIYQVEFGVNLSDNNNNVVNGNDGITMRNSFVGLAGGFGTFVVGRHDTPMKMSTGKLDLFSDTMADYNGTVGFRDLRADNAIAYISPNWSGFTLAAATVAGGGANALGNDGGAGNLDADSISEAYSIAAMYSNGPFFASVAYESLSNNLFNDTATSLYGSDCPYQFPEPAARMPGDPYAVSCGYTSEDANSWRIGLGILDWNGFTLTGIYENRDNDIGSGTYVGIVDPMNPANSFLFSGGPDSVELWQIQAGYSFGNNTIKAMYGQADRSGEYAVGANAGRAFGGPVFLKNLADEYDGDSETWAIGFDHNFSKRTRAYALYTEVNSDQENVVSGSDWSGFSLGMIHSF